MRLIIAYIADMLRYIIVFSPVILIIRFLYLKKSRRKVNFKNEIIILLFCMYIIGLASQTILPNITIGIVSETGEMIFEVNWRNSISQVNFIPFRTLSDQLLFNNTNTYDLKISLLNISANLFLFSPIGFFVPFLWNKFNSIKCIFFIGLSLTTCIECIQYLIGRSTDIDDIILNVSGIMIGYIVFKISKRLIRTS